MAAPDRIAKWGNGLIYSWYDINLATNYETDPVPFSVDGWTRAGLSIVRNVNPTGGTITGWTFQANYRQEPGEAFWTTMQLAADSSPVTQPSTTVPTGNMYIAFKGDKSGATEIFPSALKWIWVVTAPPTGSLHEVSIAVW